MPSYTQYLDDVVDVEARIGARSQDATALWCGELGPLVARRPSTMNLGHIVARIVAQVGTRRSAGYLSKAATVWTHLVRGLGMDPNGLGRFTQSDLWAAAVAVRDGRLPADASTVADALASGTVPTETKHRAPKAPKRDDPEPTPDPEVALALRVLAIAKQGAAAAGVDVETWTQDRAAESILAGA
jgi:hypothetical protein